MRRTSTSKSTPRPDLLSRMLRERPETLAKGALLSWVLTGIVFAEHVRTGAWGSSWPLGILPIGLTMLASLALMQRDPERSGLDAFRSGMLAMIPSAVLVGRAVVQRFEHPSTGHVATASMAGAAVGSVLAALCGPVAGWFVRRLTRTARRVATRMGRRV